MVKSCSSEIYVNTRIPLFNNLQHYFKLLNETIYYYY